MATERYISPQARSENMARADLADALRDMHYVAGNPDEAISKVLSALDRYIEAKLQPRSY